MSTTIVPPTYLAGNKASMTIATSTTPLALPITMFKAHEESGTFDNTNATTHGYEHPEASTRKCTFSFECVWKKTGGAPPVAIGNVYAIKMNTQQVSGGTATPVYEGFDGNGLIMTCETSSTIKGETKYSGTGQFQGVYDSPSRPTAIADAAANAGEFAPPA